MNDEPMKITILDHTNNQTIVRVVPEKLSTTGADEILEHFAKEEGFNIDDCEYMIGEFRVDIKI